VAERRQNIRQSAVFYNSSVELIQENDFFTVRQIYECHENGFELSVDFIPRKVLPPIIPKIGLCLEVPETFEELLWFGRGPQECYRDRCGGIKIGHYSANVDALWNSYVMPQENGNHCDVYCSCICDKNGTGIGCYSEIPFETSLKRWDAVTIDKAQHEYELPPHKSIYWSLDWENSGVGNGSHGPGTLDKYCVHSEKISWKWKFFAFTKCFSRQYTTRH
jgi:hypothetical protein